MWSKTRYLLLAFVLMLIFAVVGCSNNDDGNDASSNNGGETNSSEGKNGNNEVEDEGPGELVTFDFFNAHKPYTDINTADTVIGKMFEEATGVNFDIEHIVGDVNTKIGTMIASGEYPHLMNEEQATDQVIFSGGYSILNYLINGY